MLLTNLFAGKQTHIVTHFLELLSEPETMFPLVHVYFYRHKGIISFHDNQSSLPLKQYLIIAGQQTTCTKQKVPVQA